MAEWVRLALYGSKDRKVVVFFFFFGCGIKRTSFFVLEWYFKEIRGGIQLKMVFDNS